MVDLFDYLLILHDNVPEHEVERLSGLNQKQLTAFLDDLLLKQVRIKIMNQEFTYQYLWDEFLLRLDVPFENGLPVAKNITLLFVIGLLKQDQTPLSFG